MGADPSAARADDADGADTPYPMVRGLARGLSVLAALNRLRAASARELAGQTGLSRPTVHRLLDTLRRLGYVERSHKRDAFQLSAQVHALSDGHHRRDGVVESGRPIIEALSRRLVWPVNIATYEDGAMVLRANTHRDSPLSLFAGLPGTRLPMLQTSIGLAYLAFCPVAESECILDLLQAEVEEGTRAAWRRALRLRLRAVRAAGFAVREGGLEPRTASIALPIRGQRRVLATLNVIWIHSALPTATAIDRLLPPLLVTAGDIERRLRDRRRLVRSKDAIRNGDP
jgi:IclR family transcriptional regulator, mhp operon transcriptional activator